MKPDGVATAALEPMETLESNPVIEAVPPVGEEPNQATNPMEEVMGQQPAGEMGQGEPRPEPPKETPATGNKASEDPKAKTTNKAPAKTKPGATKTGPGSRPNTAQSRLTNGVTKPQPNGLAKKTTTTTTGTSDKKTTTTGTPDKKTTTTTSAASKKPAGAPASKTPTKVGEKKPIGTTRPSTASTANGVKSATGAAATKKTPSGPATGVKTSSTSTAAVAKKPTAPKPASAAPTKPSSAASPKPDRPPVSKTTRPPTGTAASRPATASTRPATANTTKSIASTAKPAPPKTTSTTPKAAATKTTSTTPSAGKTPTSQASKTTTPVKKDVTKPTTPAAKKPAASLLTRPSPAAKSAKPETPKSASKADTTTTTKKPAASKATDIKTPTPKSKPTPSKDAAKPPSSKPAATKTSSPKKAVGSSTPTPVKRGPKTATLAPPAESDKKGEKEAVAAVAAAAAIATVAVAIAKPGEPEPEPTVEAPVVEELELVSTQAETTPEPSPEPASIPQLSAQLDLVHLGEPASDSVPPLGTTIMSPPCSPPGPMSPVREPQNASPLLDMHVQPDPWDQSLPLEPSTVVPQSLAKEEMTFQPEEEEEEEEEEEKEEEEKENLFMPTATAQSADDFSVMTQPDLMGGFPTDDFTSGALISPHRKEEAVEKADEEINEDDEDEDEEDEEQRRLGHHPSSMFTDLSSSQPSEEFQVKSTSFGGSAGWHGEDLLSGMDSEDVSSSTSSRQQGVSDLSSTQHTALLEGTQSSDALVDSSLRGSEGDGNFIGSPNVETLANEEEEDEEEEEERVDDMDVSSERAEEQHKVFQQQEQDEEDDEDVEMPSEGVTESGLESCGNADEDDFNEEERLDNLNRSALPPIPPASAWGQTNPFSDPWAQPSLLSASSPSPLSDHGAADPETPTQSPAQAWLDSSAPSLAPQFEREPQSAHDLMESSAPEEASAPPAAPAVGMSQSSTLSGTALAAHSSSETSTPEELRDYDSSSGVESHSDKQQTPVPTSVHPDMEQDLGIHLEKGDGEEEEAETLPADEVLGAGPPTAPASAPSSPSTSGDEASDTEGEMQINDPDAPVTGMDDSTGFDSPTPAHNLPALEEDEEAAEAPAGEGEEDGGGATPQSANSVASYGFDCTTSNSNAHSTAESCGKSPGIFSLENEDQLPEEAKDPSLIKELTLPSAAAAQAEDLLGRPVDLMPLGHPGETQVSLDDHHYMLGGKMMAEDDLDEFDPLEPGHHLGAQHAGDPSDGQPPYYSTICDKTDSFLAGEDKSDDDDGGDAAASQSDEDQEQQTHSQGDNQNQNLLTADPIANGHYLALVPGNRRPIDPTLAAHFAKIAPPPSSGSETNSGSSGGGSQLRKLQQHQEHLREVQQRQEQERQKRQWLEEERLRLEQQKQLEKQRRELLQLQLQQQQQEHRHRRHILQWQMELEQQHRLQQKQILQQQQQQQQQQMRRSPSGVMLSPSSGLCTIYEAMETSEEEDGGKEDAEQNGNMEDEAETPEKRAPSNHTLPQDPHRQLGPIPPQDLDWNQKVDMVQQLINQTLLLSGDRGCPPLLLLPVGTGGTLSPLETSMWPSLLPPFSPTSATVTSVSSYSPDSQGSSPPGDWTVVELETQH